MKLLKLILKTDTPFLFLAALYIGDKGGTVDIAIAVTLGLIAIKNIVREWR